MKKLNQIMISLLTLVICQSCATKATVEFYKAQARIAEAKIEAIKVLKENNNSNDKLLSLEFDENQRIKKIELGHQRNPNLPSDIAVISNINIKKKPLSEASVLAIEAMNFLKVPAGILAGGWAAKQMLGAVNKGGDTVNSYNSAGQDMSSEFTGDAISNSSTVTDSYNNITTNTDNADSNNTANSTSTNTTNTTSSSDDDSTVDSNNTSTSTSTDTTNTNSGNTNNSVNDSNNDPTTNNNYDYSDQSTDSSTSTTTNTTTTDAPI